MSHLAHRLKREIVSVDVQGFQGQFSVPGSQC
jgi:hypothetical protein